MMKRVFDLFNVASINKEVVIKNECEMELFSGKFGDVSMKYGYFKVCKVIEEDDIMIVYI